MENQLQAQLLRPGGPESTLRHLPPVPDTAPALDLRFYQQQAVDGVFAAWSEFDRVLGVAPTGSFGRLHSQQNAREKRLRSMGYKKRGGRLVIST